MEQEECRAVPSCAFCLCRYHAIGQLAQLDYPNRNSLHTRDEHVGIKCASWYPQPQWQVLMKSFMCLSNNCSKKAT